MEIKFVDAHGHLNFPEYDIDREAVIERCREKGVLAVTVSVDTESSCKALELAKKYPDVVRATAGLHPMCAWGEAPEAFSPPCGPPPSFNKRVGATVFLFLLAYDVANAELSRSPVGTYRHYLKEL